MTTVGKRLVTSSMANAMRSTWWGLLMLLAPWGCEEPASPSDPAIKAEAERIWQERCTTCHGPKGDGDGPQARHLQVKPRRLSDRAWQSTVSDEHLRTVILEGGPAVGKHPLMAPNPDLRSKPAVLDALVQHVRGL